MKFSRRYLQFIRSVSRNNFGKTGVVLVTSSFIMFFVMELAWFLGLVDNAYVGLISYMALPALFLIGLILVPIGWQRQKSITGQSGLELLESEFGKDGIKAAITGSHIFKTVGLLSLLNVLFLILASTQTLQFMDEPKFCGTACHEVMNPEWQTYQVSAHASVNCVSCHVGEGTEALVESKLNGLWQMVSMTFDLYERPIPVPVHQLRPATETCENCHWPSKQFGDELIKKVNYTNEEFTQPLYTTLSMKIDSKNNKKESGVHWHIEDGVNVNYTTLSSSREQIKTVVAEYPDGSIREFENTNVTLDDDLMETRTMDCVDCHNRAAHIYRSPESIVDQLLMSGDLPSQLPFIKREALNALRTHARNKETGREQVVRYLSSYYRIKYPDFYYENSNQLSKAGELLAIEYDRYIHPNMNIEWDTYPSHLGHDGDSGCFRCHNQNMVDKSGEAISSDCTLCHDILAYDSQSPFEFLESVDTTNSEADMHYYLKHLYNSGK